MGPCARAAGFTVPNFYFQASLLGTPNNLALNLSTYIKCFKAATAVNVQQGLSCPYVGQCTKTVVDGPPYVDPAFPYNNIADNLFYWRGTPAAATMLCCRTAWPCERCW